MTPAEATSGDWSTRSLPAGLRGEAVRAMLSSVHLPWQLALRDKTDQQCRLAWTAMGSATLIECRSAPLSGWRGRREIRRTEGDTVGVLLVLAGRENVRQGDVAARLGPGDILIWDGARPIDFEVVDPLHKVTLLVPRSVLERMAPAALCGSAIPIDGRSGLGGLVAGHLTALTRIARGIPAAHQPVAADMVVDLIARLMSPDQPNRAAGDLVARILARVETGLDDPDLGPRSLAAEFGVTPRYLHMAFAATGRTLAAHIRTRRLERIRRDLDDPRLGHLSITEIALRWGFSDSAHASRAFSAAFGLPPGRYRVRSRA